MRPLRFWPCLVVFTAGGALFSAAAIAQEGEAPADETGLSLSAGPWKMIEPFPFPTAIPDVDWEYLRDKFTSSYAFYMEEEHWYFLARLRGSSMLTRPIVIENHGETWRDHFEIALRDPQGRLPDIDSVPHEWLDPHDFPEHGSDWLEAERLEIANPERFKPNEAYAVVRVRTASVKELWPAATEETYHVAFRYDSGASQRLTPCYTSARARPFRLSSGNTPDETLNIRLRGAARDEYFGNSDRVIETLRELVAQRPASIYLRSLLGEALIRRSGWSGGYGQPISQGEEEWLAQALVVCKEAAELHDAYFDGRHIDPDFYPLQALLDAEERGIPISRLLPVAPGAAVVAIEDRLRYIEYKEEQQKKKR